MSKPIRSSFPIGRTSGVLLHVTSLPGPYGVGDLGPQAYRWVDWLASAKQTWWQTLPLGPPGAGDSPYQCFSAFAGNPLLISPELLVREGLLRVREVRPSDRLPEGKADHAGARALKTGILLAAHENFRNGSAKPLRPAFEGFREEHADWLRDYALFTVLHEAHLNQGWNRWPRNLVRRKAAALKAAAEGLGESIERVEFIQFLFFRQLAALRAYARERGVRFLGDLPIYVSPESADVWANQELFLLDRKGAPKAVAGVPPDAFSETGQRWGNPLYDWNAMQKERFAWWVRRVRASLLQADLLRIDHFRGFESFWQIPAQKPTAQYGRWVKAPGVELFTELEKRLGGLPFIAEDLGLITPEVEALRDRFGLPGMRVLHFAFGDDPRNLYLPHNHVPNTAVYTGTHDNDTTVGWFRSLDDKTRKAVEAYVPGVQRDPSWALIRLALASVGRVAIVPAQDLLRLGNEGRMNVPGSATENWRWRLKPGAMTPKLAARLAELTSVYGRDSQATTDRGISPSSAQVR